MEVIVKEELMDKLLVSMNREVEKEGDLINHINFNFSEGEEDCISSLESLNIEFSSLIQILNTLLSRKFIVRTAMGMGMYNRIQLSEEGQARAISVTNSDSERVAKIGNIHINTLNTNAPTQIGNYNTQDIHQIFNQIEKSIKESDASDEEKNTALEYLKIFLRHPLTSVAIATTVAALGGGG